MLIDHGGRMILDVKGRPFHHRGTFADLGVIRQIFEEKDYDLTALMRFPEIQKFYDSCKNPLIVDAGGNIGAAVVWFSQMFPKSFTISIEPDQANFDLLQKNTSGLNVRPVLGALASKSGVLNLYNGPDGEWSYQTIDNGTAPIEVVKAYSAEDLLGLVSAEPFLFKVDIEGAEEDVFGSNTEIFEKFPVLIVELHDYQMPRSASSRSFLKWHSTQNRDFIYIGENIFSLDNDLLPLV